MNTSMHHTLGPEHAIPDIAYLCIILLDGSFKYILFDSLNHAWCPVAFDLYHKHREQTRFLETSRVILDELLPHALPYEYCSKRADGKVVVLGYIKV